MFKLSFTVAAVLFAVLQLHGKIILASGGKTEYTIVAPEKMSRIEKEAVKDLRYHLQTITGAGFRIGRPGSKNIFVGRKAPSDTKALARYERRIKSENGNIYLYGYGSHGSSNAIYDFLEDFLGCQWYGFYSTVKIPKQETVTFEKLDSSIIPDFLHASYSGSFYTQNSNRANAFRRRSRLYDRRDPNGGAAVPMLGFNDGHMPIRIVPPGKEYLTSEKPRKARTVKYFADKKYFKTNPEFFSMNKHGRRTPNYQHCYSNPGLRRTMIENYQLIFDKEYRGGPAHIYADLNDKGFNGMPCCWCKPCSKLNKEYRHPAGSYWDYIIELGNHFKDKYPEIKFRVTAYGITLNKPHFPKALPPNLLLRIAPLGTTDFAKSYRDGGTAIDFIRQWSGVYHGDFMIQLYPTTYERPLWGRPLTANIRRLIRNLRDLKKLGINALDMEFGVGPNGTVWFNEMRIYLIAKLSRNVNLDEKELIRDFMENHYGKAAAPIMLKYYLELEELEAAEPQFLRWWPDFRSALSYLTPENLLRWQGYFDEMLKVTDPKSRHHLNIRRTRLNLDEATMAVWYKFAPGQMPDRDMLKKRHAATVFANSRDILRTLIPANEKQNPERLLPRLLFFSGRSIYYHYALAGKWKNLPAPFDSMPEGTLLRTVPFINQQVLNEDPDAATGIAAKGRLPERFNFIMSEFRQKGRRKDDIRTRFREILTPEMVQKSPRGKYHLYYIGTSRLFPDCQFYTNSIIHAGGVSCGYLFDTANPDQKYDIYLSLKLEENGQTLWFDQAVFVKSSKSETLHIE